jgi:hypothetical protein
MPGSKLRLTKLDDEIYDHLMADFPEFDPAKTIDEDEMKSKAGKERWRKFMMAYEKKVEDYNFGTMLRTDPKHEYEQDTTIFGRFYHSCTTLLSYTSDWHRSSSNAILRYRDCTEQKGSQRLD